MALESTKPRRRGRKEAKWMLTPKSALGDFVHDKVMAELKNRDKNGLVIAEDGKLHWASLERVPEVEELKEGATGE